MGTMRDLFESLGLASNLLPSFMCDSEILYDFDHISNEALKHYFTSHTFKEDITFLKSKVNMFIDYFGCDVKFAMFFPRRDANLHLDVFPLVH